MRPSRLLLSQDHLRMMPVTGPIRPLSPLTKGERLGEGVRFNPTSVRRTKRTPTPHLTSPLWEGRGMGVGDKEKALI